MRIRSDSIVSSDGNSEVSAVAGVTVSSGYTIHVQGNLSVSGIGTIPFVSTTDASVGILTAPIFFGDGSGLTELSVATQGKSIAFKYIIGDPPLRS